MTITSNYKNAFTEVYTILQDLNEDEYAKIPPEVIQAIKENRNKDYNYEIDEYTELNYQPMLPETKAILFNIFRDYLATPEQKAKILRMQNEERAKNEIKKKQKYSTDNIFKQNTKENMATQAVQETEALVEIKKENLLKRITEKIRKLLCKF